MHIETKNRNCPLCKLAAATNGHNGSTRLCETCRLMIETILPRRAATPVARPQYAASAASRWDVARSVEFEAEAQEEDYELVSLEPTLDAEKDFLEETEEIFGRSAAPAETASNVETVSTEAREAFTSPPQSEAFDKNAISQPNAEFKSVGSRLDQTEEAISRLEAEQAPASNGAQTETVGDLKAVTEESAIDPWDDPLPAWEYSRNEWPIIVEAKKPSAFARLKVPIAIGVLAAFAIIAYFVFKSTAEKPQEQISIATPEINAQEASKAAQTPTPAPASNALPASNPVPAQAAASDEGSAQWRYSLQAMSSQNESEATEFAEKLVRAGVAAYVVSVDLGQRGRWHRVRVGRFFTADEATRFAGEARERAKAAGVALKNLNLCAYEKP